MITILVRYNLQSYHHALYPILTSRYSGLFSLTDSVEHCLRRDANRILVILNFFKQRYAQVEANRALLVELRQRYRKVVLFDDSDGADSLHGELIDLVDLYYKKQILVDRQHYLKPAYGRQRFSDYYHQVAGVTDERPEIREAIASEAELSKLRLAWNLGLAAYPFNRLRRHASLWLQRHAGWAVARLAYPRMRPRLHGRIEKLPVVQARFSHTAYSASIGYQRLLFGRLFAQDGRVKTGRVSKAAYEQELQTAAAVVSPFGWGEVCYRDFEAIIYGAALLKPDMGGVDTWPDIYVAGETYYPLDWQGRDAAEVVNRVISCPREAAAIALNAFDRYRACISAAADRVDLFVSEVLA